MDSGPSLGQNVEPLAQIMLGVGVSVAFHPMTFTKTLIQIGYEPLPPVPKTSIFGRQVLAYPSVFKYMGHIKATDGFLGLYRGLSARLVGGVIGSAVQNSVSQHMKTHHPVPSTEIDEDDDAMELFKRVCRETSQEMAARCAGVIASHPCHVIMLRSMAQFVGREEEYRGVAGSYIKWTEIFYLDIISFFGSIVKIYNDEGILGFFAGLAPRLLGEVITIWLVNMVVHALNQYVLPKQDAHGPKGLKSYTNAICTMMVTQITYPFSLVSNMMAISGCGLAAGSPPHMLSFPSWTDCWRALSKEGQLKRGSSLFWRYYKGPVILRHDGKPMPASMGKFS